MDKKITEKTYGKAKIYFANQVCLINSFYDVHSSVFTCCYVVAKVYIVVYK